jgi:GGDEF domain-containing protein
MMISTEYLFIMLCAALSLWAISSWRRRWNRRGSRRMSILLQGTGLSSFRDSLPQIIKEFARARRLDRPLSVIVIFWDDSIPEGGGSANPKELKHLMQRQLLLCVNITRNALRDMDIVSHDIVNRRFIIVVPESTNRQANELAKRLRTLIGATIPEELRIGLATFPTDRLVIEDLIDHAVKSAQGRADSAGLDGVISNVSRSI